MINITLSPFFILLYIRYGYLSRKNAPRERGASIIILYPTRVGRRARRRRIFRSFYVVGRIRSGDIRFVRSQIGSHPLPMRRSRYRAFQTI